MISFCFFFPDIENWPLHALKDDVEVMAAGRENVDYEPVSAGFLDGDDLETHAHVADSVGQKNFFLHHICLYINNCIRPVNIHTII